MPFNFSAQKLPIEITGRKERGMKFGIFIYDGVEPIDLATFGVLSMARRIRRRHRDLHAWRRRPAR